MLSCFAGFIILFPLFLNAPSLPHSQAYSMDDKTQVMTNLDSVLKSWDITLLTKVHLVNVMVFPVDMYEY